MARERWEYFGEEWKGDTPENEKAERKARKEAEELRLRMAWYRRRLVTILREKLFSEWPDGPKFDRVVEFYVARSDKYLAWTDVKNYVGTGYSDGSWSVDAPAVVRDWKHAVFATQVHSINDWLYQFTKDQLPPAVAERGGAILLPKGQRRKLWLSKVKYERRICRRCGGEFRGAFTPTGAVRSWQSCGPCLDAAAAAKQAKKGESRGG